MKMFVAPVPSEDREEAVCSAAMSQRRRRAAAEWRTGIETRVMTLETMCASRRVHVPPATRGKSSPLKKQAGL